MKFEEYKTADSLIELAKTGVLSDGHFTILALHIRLCLPCNEYDKLPPTIGVGNKTKYLIDMSKLVKEISLNYDVC